MVQQEGPFLDTRPCSVLQLYYTLFFFQVGRRAQEQEIHEAEEARETTRSIDQQMADYQEERGSEDEAAGISDFYDEDAVTPPEVSLQSVANENYEK